MNTIQKFLPILLLTFVNVIGFSLLIPVLPSVVEHYVEPEYVGTLYGALLSSYALFQFLAAPVLGALSDRYGRKPLLIISQAGTTLSWVIFGAAYFIPGELTVGGIALPLLVIAFSRVVDGITGGNISVADAWISDETTPENRSRIYGMVGATFGIGFLLGPSIGGISASTEIGYLGTAIVAFLISVVTWLYIEFGLPESLPESKRDAHIDVHWLEHLNIVRQFTQFRANRLVMDLLFIRIFFALTFASYTTLLTLMLQRQFQFTTNMIGLSLSVLGVFSVFNQLVVTPFLSKKLGDLKALYVSILALLTGFLLLTGLPSLTATMGYVTGVVGFFGIAYILMVGVSVAQPVFKTLLTHQVDPTKQGAIIGLDSSLFSLGQAVTPIIAGSLYSVVQSWTFLFFAGVLLIPHLIIWLREGHPLLRATE